jgi:hypothetical protein
MMDLSQIESFLNTNLSVIIQSLTLFGVAVTVWAVLMARRSLRAQTVAQFIKDWRDPEMYDAIRYINELRAEWKEKCSPVTDPQSWNAQAEKWAKDHFRAKTKKLRKEWMLRRNASQFIAKMGLMAQSHYMKTDDLFGILPEMGRYLMVLIPIEIAIQETADFEEPIADWDHPVVKYEFDYIWHQYQGWYQKHRDDIVLHPIDFANLDC